MKTETYTVLDYREFDQLVKEHLGVEIQEPGHWTGGYSFQQDMESGQDTYFIFSYDEFEEESAEWLEENYCASYSYVKQLFDKGVFLKEHPVFLQVWW